MKKLVNDVLLVFSVGALLLSGCGMRPCLHTNMGCEIDNAERENACSGFGGPTTGCHSSNHAYLVN